jgi:hypothetical protein
MIQQSPGYRRPKIYVVKCDAKDCDLHQEIEASSWSDMINQMKEDGWCIIRHKEVFNHYCDQHNPFNKKNDW